MEIKDLLANLAKYDEMEAEDGMNIAESEEVECKVTVLAGDEKINGFDFSCPEDKLNSLSVKFEKLGKEGYTPIFEESNEEIVEEKEESIDEAFVEEGLGKEKVVRSDLDFGIKAQIVDDGIYFGAVGFGPKAVIYRASDHEASEAELVEVQKRAVEAIEEAINALEDKIIGIFNERGFRADAE